MKKFFLKYKYYFLIVFIVVPILINIVVISKNPFGWTVAGNESDWITFWASYISSIASFAMVLITFETLEQNKKQFDEMKKQWDEERLPNLILSVGISQHALFLKVCNIGLYPAYNVKLSINDEFYNSLPSDAAKKCFDSFIEPFYVDGKSTKYVYIGAGDEIESHFAGKNIILSVKGVYCKNMEVSFSCNMSEIIGKKFARVTDDLTIAVENIERSISSAKAIPPYHSIQKSLDIISKCIEKSNKENESAIEIKQE